LKILSGRECDRRLHLLNVKPSRQYLSRSLSIFIHMTNARKDYIGKRSAFGFKSRLSNHGLIAIFTPLVVMACYPNFRRMLVELHYCRGRRFESYHSVLKGLKRKLRGQSTVLFHRNLVAILCLTPFMMNRNGECQRNYIDIKVAGSNPA